MPKLRNEAWLQVLKQLTRHPARYQPYPIWMALTTGGSNIQKVVPTQDLPNTGPATICMPNAEWRPSERAGWELLFALATWGPLPTSDFRPFVLHFLQSHTCGSEGEAEAMSAAGASTTTGTPNGGGSFGGKSGRDRASNGGGAEGRDPHVVATIAHYAAAALDLMRRRLEAGDADRVGAGALPPVKRVIALLERPPVVLRVALPNESDELVRCNVFPDHTWSDIMTLCCRSIG